MNENASRVLELAVQPGQRSDFGDLITEMARVASDEAGPLNYDLL